MVCKLFIGVQDRHKWFAFVAFSYCHISCVSYTQHAATAVEYHYSSLSPCGVWYVSAVWYGGTKRTGKEAPLLFLSTGQLIHILYIYICTTTATAAVSHSRSSATSSHDQSGQTKNVVGQFGSDEIRTCVCLSLCLFLSSLCLANKYIYVTTSRLVFSSCAMWYLMVHTIQITLFYIDTCTAVCTGIHQYPAALFWDKKST